MTRIGLLHPGNMGSAVATTLVNGGHEVLWASAGRNPRSQTRAQEAGLVDVGTVRELCQRSEIIFSVCPPEFADTVADEVISVGFKGLFVDANAIAPARTIAIGERMKRAGVTFVDGGIIGPASVKPRTVWMYVSGAAAPSVAECFAAGPMIADVVGTDIGQASGLKMCFAAYNKGRAALLASTLAAAEHFGVREIIHQQWEHRDGPQRAEAEGFVTSVAPRAWRFVAEMREISSTFATAGLPGEFHEGAARLYEMLREFKDAEDLNFDDVLAALTESRPVGSA